MEIKSCFLTCFFLVFLKKSRQYYNSIFYEHIIHSIVKLMPRRTFLRLRWRNDSSIQKDVNFCLSRRWKNRNFISVRRKQIQGKNDMMFFCFSISSITVMASFFFVFFMEIIFVYSSYIILFTSILYELNFKYYSRFMYIIYIMYICIVW